MLSHRTPPQLFLFSLAASLVCSCTNTIATSGSTIASYEGAVLYSGAYVWEDGQFIEKSFVVKDDIFIEVPEDAISTLETMDLTGKYIMPPFGDGHTHQIEGAFGLERFNRQFFEQGVFYAQNPAGLPRLMKRARKFTNRADTIDVSYAMGAITTPFGHPERAYVDIMTQYSYRGETRETFRGTAIHAVKTEEDVRRSIDILKEDRADFVKLVLEFSEAYEERSRLIEAAAENTEQLGIFDSSGMDPELVPIAVRYAHAGDLPVKAHVTTAHDFRVAVAAGVDSILHMPGTFPRDDSPLSIYELAPDDAKSAAHAGVDVVATTAVRLGFIKDDEREDVFALQKENIRTLLEQGVPVLIGIDNYGETTRTEIDHLRNIGAMSDQELLTAWIATGQSIFPERKIGAIASGYEASFLVLDANPLEDFSTLDRIVSRTKEGKSVILTTDDE